MWFFGLHKNHANLVVLRRCGSLPFFFFPLMQNSYVIWILFIWKSCLCIVQASHREASSVMKFPYVNPMVMKRIQKWKVTSEIFPKHFLKQCRINVDEQYLNIIDLNLEILETCWLCMEMTLPKLTSYVSPKQFTTEIWPLTSSFPGITICKHWALWTHWLKLFVFPI